MRPEYLEAVESAKFGWSLAVTLALPVAIILAAFLVNRFYIKHLTTQNRTLILVSATAFAYMLFIGLAAHYVNNIQHVKQITMLTNQEIADCGADNPFGLLLAFPAGLLVCGSAFFIGLIATGLSRIHIIKSSTTKTNNGDFDEDLGETWENPYPSR